MAFELKKLDDWTSTFKEDRVQSHNLGSGDFLSSETAVIVSGPANITSEEIVNLVPIGLAQNFNVNQGKQIFTFNEIGSSKPFMIPGRTRTSANISRILFDGPSLMYVMNLSAVGGGSVNINDVPINVGGISGELVEDVPSLPWITETGDVTPTGEGKLSTPGQFFINLRSSFFNRPLGLGVVLYDNESEPYGGFYLEECYINGHNMSLASQSVVIMENVSLFATNLVPLNPTEWT
jgi:hypothetical protein